MDEQVDGMSEDEKAILRQAWEKSYRGLGSDQKIVFVLDEQQVRERAIELFRFAVHNKDWSYNAVERIAAIIKGQEP